jgi:hypothetical protein
VRPYLKKPFTRVFGVAQDEGPEVKPQYHKKEKKRKKKIERKNKTIIISLL